MIRVFLLIVGLVVLIAASFFWGVTYAVKELQVQAPDLLIEWKRRRDAGEVRK